MGVLRCGGCRKEAEVMVILMGEPFDAFCRSHARGYCRELRKLKGPQVETFQGLADVIEHGMTKAPTGKVIVQVQGEGAEIADCWNEVHPLPDKRFPTDRV